MNESFPYALQVGLEEMLVKERKSPSDPWMEVVESLGHGKEGFLPIYPLEQPYP